MIEIHPIRLTDGWNQGFALDIHTVRSEVVDVDGYGRPVFNNQRSQIGELLYQLKYQRDRTAVDAIVEVAVKFIKVGWGIGRSLHGVVPVPASKARDFQPVMVIARAISTRLEVPFEGNIVSKVRNTPQLKDVEPDQRLGLLKDAFSVDVGCLMGRNVLLVDDLYRSGATLSAVSRVLQEVGKANKVYVLALTKTRVSS